MAHNKLRRLIDSDDKIKLAVGCILAGNSSGLASAVSLIGAVTLGSAGSVIIGNASITSALINTSAVNASKIMYTRVSITILGSQNSLSAYGTQTITANAELMGIWIKNFNSMTDMNSGLTWYCSFTPGATAVRVDIEGPNPKPTGGKYIFQGVVIEP
jgi:hypothetical protein